MTSDYRNIPRSEVPEWLRDVAERAAVDAARELGIPAPAVRWQKAENGGRVMGWTNDQEPDVINLVSGNIRNAYHARSVTFHECRHLWQFKTSRFLGRKEGERDAIEWAWRQTRYADEQILEGEL